MVEVRYEVRPIRMDEWLPDGCMGYGGPIDPRTDKPGSGCDSLQPYTQGSRERLIDMYREVLEGCGCCGFVVWIGDRVVGYNNFFPQEWAGRIRFYGWGMEEERWPRTLVHNCISIKDNPRYRRKGIGTSLIEHSLGWAQEHGWKRFEVHLVTADSPAHFAGEQKSCRGFWEKLGFQVVGSEGQADDTLFSMAIDLDHWSG